MRDMSDPDRAMVKTAWLERLITGAKASGARVPRKRGPIMSSSDSDESEAEGAQARLPSFFRKHQPVRRREPTINLVSSESEDESRETSANRRPTSDKHQPVPHAVQKRKRSADAGSGNEATSTAPPQPNKQARLGMFGWKPMTREEAHEKWRTEAAATKERSMKLAQQEEEQREQKAAHRREIDRVRQQRHRAKKAALKKTQPGLASAKERIRVRASPKRGELTNLAEISRPHGSVWKKKRNGKKLHIPDNADELCERTFFRIIHAVVMYDIPPSLIIGMDQTGVMVLPNNNTTYEETGVRQVNVVAKDEKRAYTLCVATSADGDILPFQQVWSGQTVKSLPDVDADGMDKAQMRGFDFSSAASAKKTSHFSTLKTMKEKILDLNLPADQRAILIIDCYPVHTSEEFRVYIWTEFRTPNRVIKHRLRQAALEFLVNSHSQQIDQGLTPEQVKITTSIKTLRNASVAPLVDVFDFLDSAGGRTVIRRAWEKCAVKEWNLSAECITSRRAKAAWREYLRKDETLRNEIEGKIGELGDLIAEEPDEEGETSTEEAYDDTDVSLRAVVQQALGVDVPEADQQASRSALARLQRKFEL
ncbi:uncharacterized protein B0H18DRAFT_1216055 [Fomitopsis serialis]|uniref:uncharacterized protein n=1 Tax=Fomitopsis serialis TaxID=139415 RepID=UPI00200865E1|nr:uncharacterized protein B0H18DRAFT_1216055 [Neoantrodia serialis]KAH9914425.1 hypothetical protein B0H18DRAFT_1216055 [Neoantrodia serialis]